MNERLDAAVAALHAQAVDTLRRWIRVPSEKMPAEAGAPFGRPLRDMLTLALEDAKNLGMQTRDFDGYIGEAEIGEGEETMGILAHLDVVPAGDGWQVDPYGAVVEDGKMYGRGTSDDKGPAVAALFAMKAVLDAGIPLKRKVRLILGCDEESGWEDIRHYQQARKMPDFGFSPDASYPVINTEKGIEQLRLYAALPGDESGASYPVYSVTAGERPNVIPGLATAEIGCADLDALRRALEQTGLDVTAEAAGPNRARIVSHGVTGHASMPAFGKNAAGQLLLALSAIGAGGGVQPVIRRLAETIGMDFTGKGLGIDGQDAISGALTLNLGVLRITPDGLEALLDIRHPVLMNGEMIRRIVGLRLEDLGIRVETASYKAPLHVPEQSRIVSSLLKVYHEVPGNEPRAIAIGGGTYSRSMDNCVAFGCTLPGHPDLAHQAGEHMALDHLLLHMRVFAHAIAELAG